MIVLIPHSNELAKLPAEESLARSLLDAVFAQPSVTGCPCAALIKKLRDAFKAYGGRERSPTSNRAWGAVSVAMIYFILVTDLYVAGPMPDQMKANHLAQLRMLEFTGPKLPTEFFQ